MRTRLALVSLLALTACSSGGSSTSGSGGGPGGEQSLQTTPTPTTSTPATAGSRAQVTQAPAATGVPAASGTATTSAAPVAPLSTRAPGRPAASKATAAGVYTLDSTGTVTLGSPGTPQDASGIATLTVSALAGGVQHSTLHRDSTGDTEQDLLVRDTGTYAASLKLTSPAFTKQFRPSPAVLLVPDPAGVGRAWSWSGRSTDGKTTVSASTTVTRTETLTLGGVKVTCVVLQTHLVLAGDVDYAADLTTWWAPSYRLPVKDHTVGKGSYNGFPFSTDITATMRSVRPS